MPERSAGFVTRFAPSANGFLHVGHARAALIASLLGSWPGVGVRLRVDDADRSRDRSAYGASLARDLRKLGLGTPPWVRSSERLGRYGRALGALRQLGVVYPCFCSRQDVRRTAVAGRLRPDGGPVYPRTCRALDDETVHGRMNHAQEHWPQWRLDLDEAIRLTGVLSARVWRVGAGWVDEFQDPAPWGDMVIWGRGNVPTIHLTSVIDDADMGVNLVTRGEDLALILPLHRLLQALLRLPAIRVLHHPLVQDEQGVKLSKRDGADRLSTVLGSDPQAVGGLGDDARRVLGQMGWP